MNLKRIDVPTARAALWALRAVLLTKQRLRRHNLAEVVVPPPPRLPAHAQRGVAIVLRRQRPSCLERSLVLQRWLASQGTSRDLVIGVTGPGPQFQAHAWLEGEAQGEQFHELLRVPYVARG